MATEDSDQRFESSRPRLGKAYPESLYIEYCTRMTLRVRNFDQPVFEIAMGGDVGAAERSMANNASPALISFADQSGLEARVKELCDEIAEEDLKM